MIGQFVGVGTNNPALQVVVSDSATAVGLVADAAVAHSYDDTSKSLGKFFGTCVQAVTDGLAIEFAKGSEAGSTSDKYVRDTVFLATVLFLVGISSHFPVLGGRYGLLGLAGALLIFSVVQLLGLPGPP